MHSEATSKHKKLNFWSIGQYKYWTLCSIKKFMNPYVTSYYRLTNLLKFLYIYRIPTLFDPCSINAPFWKFKILDVERSFESTELFFWQALSTKNKSRVNAVQPTQHMISTKLKLANWWCWKIWKMKKFVLNSTLSIR